MNQCTQILQSIMTAMQIKVRYKPLTFITAMIKTVPSTRMIFSALIALLVNGRKPAMTSVLIVVLGCTNRTIDKTHVHLADRECGAIKLGKLQTFVRHAPWAIIPPSKGLRMSQHATPAHQANTAMLPVQKHRLRAWIVLSMPCHWNVLSIVKIAFQENLP